MDQTNVNGWEEADVTLRPTTADRPGTASGVFQAATPVPKITLDDWLKEGSDTINEFLWRSAVGCRMRPPPGYKLEETQILDQLGNRVKVVHHLGTKVKSVASADASAFAMSPAGVKILYPPFLPTADHPVWIEDGILVYHFTDKERFTHIVSHRENKAGVLAERMLLEPGHNSFGTGCYATLNSMDHFGSKEDILINNYINSAHESIEPHMKKADYCIPLLVPRSFVKIVTEEATVEVQRAGFGPGHMVSGEDIRAGRDVCIVVLHVDDCVLTEAEAKMRVEAVCQLVADARAGGDREVIENCFEDPDHAVRRTALEALGEVVPSGDEEAMNLITEGLDDRNWSVRRAAVQALTKVIPQGHPQDTKVMDLVSNRLKDDFWVVRVAAVRAIPKVAFITPSLEDDDWYVRQAAVETIAKNSKKGDTTAINLIRSSLKDEETRIRLAAVKATQKVATRAKAIELISGRFEDAEWNVRQAAVETIADVGSSTGDAKSLEQIAYCFHDEDVRVRVAAVKSAARFLPHAKSRAKAVEHICHRSGDAEAPVRQAAVDAIASVATKGDSTAMGFLSFNIQDEAAEVRVAAICAVAAQASRGDTETLMLVGPIVMQDQDSSVRIAAMNAVAAIAEQGDSEALTLLGPLIGQDEDPAVRAAALRAFGKLALPGDEQAMDLVAQGAEDSDVLVRDAAVETMAEMSS